MKKNNIDRILFAVTISDVQMVAKQILGRQLKPNELTAFEQELSKNHEFDWQAPVQNAIREVINDYILEDTSKLDIYSILDEEDDDYEEHLVYR